MQIYTPFTAPESIMRGAEQFGAGIAGGLASIGDAFEKAQDKKKQRAAQGKAADAFVKSTPGFLGKLGMDEHDWALLSPDDKAAAMQGGLKAQAFAEGQTQERHRLMQLQAMEQEISARDQAAKNEGRFPAFARSLAEMGQRREDLPQVLAPEEMDRRSRPLDLGGLMDVSSRTGYQPKLGELDDLLRAAAAGKKGEIDWEGLKPREGMTSLGTPFIYDRLGNPHFDPGIKASDFSGDEEPFPMRDENGNILGYRVPGTKQVLEPHREVTGKTKPLLDEAGVAIPGLAVSEKGQIVKVPVKEEEKPGLMDRIKNVFGIGDSPKPATNSPAAPQAQFRYNPKTKKLEK